MTADEFESRMRALAGEPNREGRFTNVDEEGVHSDMDRLMTDLLRSLGYGKGIDIFDKTSKWYA